jgi:hypothetical protein
MARPIIVTAVTTANGAQFGPGECHGVRPYSRRTGPVKGSVYHSGANGRRNAGFLRKERSNPVPTRGNSFAAILPNV